jgi:DNA-binding transcriptional MocR family regulator
VADFLYKGVVDWFLDQMSQEAITPGDRMPSLRALSKELGLSLNTVIHGYELLTTDGWIESRPKSGYFVCHRSKTKPALLLAGESLQTLPNDGSKPAWSCLAHRSALVDQSDAFLTPITRQEEVNLPILGKGHLVVRESVSEYLKGLGIKSHASQLWLGRSPLAMFTQAVQNLTGRGDTVLVLTPCDPRITTTLQSLGRKVIALNAGERGADLDLVIQCLRDESINLIVLPGQFSFPAGQVISNLSLRRWLAIIEEMQLPVIEWDLCSHLAYRPGPLLTYKSLDQSDHIVYIGGVESKGVDRSASWCLPGRHQGVLEGAFLGADMALNDAQQGALSDALQPNSKRSLTKRARSVWANSERVKSHLETRLGEHVSFAANKGGMSLWMCLSKPLDVTSIASLLVNFRHAIVPGALVSHESDANHWLAVNVTLDDVEPLAQSLAEHLSIDEEEPEETAQVEEAKGVVEPQEDEFLVEEIQIENRQVEDASESIESETPSAEEGDKKALDATTEPLYNPMLDLINHDFG